MAKTEKSDGTKVIQFIEQHCMVPEGSLVGQPMRLLPFQKKFILDVYDNPAGTRHAYMSIARKNGKLLRCDEPIPTPLGWVANGDLQVGDLVFGVDGKPCRVTGAFDVEVPSKAYRLTFSDGATIEAGGEHQWETSHRWRPWDQVQKGPRKGEFGVKGNLITSVVTTEQIACSLLYPRQDSQVEWNHSIQLCEAIDYPEQPLPLDPYTLGVWLADGTSRDNKIEICRQDEEIIDYLAVEARRVEDIATKGSSLWRLGERTGKNNNVRDILRDLDLFQNKHIPGQYLIGSIQQRRSLLQGLLDGDGHATVSAGTCSTVQICQKNDLLADAIMELIRSLGFKPTCTKRDGKIDGIIVGQYNNIQFSAGQEDNVFRLRRKNQILKPSVTGTRSRSRQIVACDPVEPSPMRCISVDGPRNLYVAGKSYIVTHNTAIIAALLLAHICGPMAKRNSQIISGALSRDQASLVFALASKMIGLSPLLTSITKVVPSGKKILGLVKNVEFKALAADGGRAHGLSPVLAILDEVGQVKGPTSDFIDAITTSQGAHDHALLIAISTQAASDADMFSMWLDDAQRSGDPTIVCHVYKADEGADLLDRKQWIKANPALGAFRSERDLEDQLKQAQRLPVKEASSRNLLLNQRVSQEKLYLAPSVWKKNGGQPDMSVFREQNVAFGIDLSARHDLTAAVMAAKDPDGVVHVLPFVFTPSQGIDERARRDRAPYDLWAKNGQLIPIGGESMDYDQVAAFLHAKCEELEIDPWKVAFDRWRIDVLKKSASDTGFAQMATWCNVGQGWKDMSPRCEAFLNLMLEGKIRHGNHPLLNMAAANAIAVNDPAGAIKLDKSKSTQRIDPLVAAVMAVYEVSEGNIDDLGSDLSWWVAA